MRFKFHSSAKNSEPKGSSAAEATSVAQPEGEAVAEDLIAEIRAQINSVDQDLFNDLDSLVPAWQEGFERNLILQIEHLLTTAPIDHNDLLWFQNLDPRGEIIISNQLNSWQYNLQKITHSTTLCTDIKPCLRRHHSPDLKHLLKYHQNNKQRTNYWATHELLDCLTQRNDNFLKYRLELNPEITYQLEMFREIMHHCQYADLAVAGSIINRQQEFYDGLPRARHQHQIWGVAPLATEVPRARTDSIVLLTTVEDVSDLIRLVKTYGEKHSSIFQKRQSTKLLAPIAPGIAISDTSHFDPYLRSHARLLSSMIRICQELAPPNVEVDFERFSSKLTQSSLTWNFYEHNLAFSYC